MAINPSRPLITVPPPIVPGMRVRFLALSADGVNAIVEVEVITGVWQAASVDRVTGEGTVVDQNGDSLPITVRNGEMVTCRFSWVGGHLLGGTQNNSGIAATVELPAIQDLEP